MMLLMLLLLTSDDAAAAVRTCSKQCQIEVLQQGPFPESCVPHRGSSSRSTFSNGPHQHSSTISHTRCRVTEQVEQGPAKCCCCLQASVL
jgi:hypothetical protein